MVMQVEDLHALVRGEAFRQLLAAGAPATREDLALAIGISTDKVARVLEELDAAGRIRFGALAATGSAASRSPATAAPITIRFRDGRPEAAGVVLFRPSDSLAASCTSVYEEWCPNSNFFEDAESARAWSARHKLEGRVLSLEEASDLATAEWLPVTRPPKRLSP